MPFLLASPDTGRHAVPKLGVSAQSARIRPLGLEKIRVAELLRPDFLQFVILIPHHHDVNIVIPRNKSFMAYSAEYRPRIRVIDNAVPVADTHEFREKVQLNRPDLLHFF